MLSKLANKQRQETRRNLVDSYLSGEVSGGKMSTLKLTARFKRQKERCILHAEFIAKAFFLFFFHKNAEQVFDFTRS